ncbi:VirK family protein [Pseudomonas kitaguniensis]|uniref:VirK family protein n=1 Tax=Pseudomonas kitaguniensis TaxID=2607908 RepID=UPI003CFF939C
MNKFCTFLLAMSLPAMSWASDALPNLPAVTQSLLAGKSVSVVLDLGLCKPGSSEARPTKTRGGLRIDAFRITEDGTLAFADDHFTVNREDKPINQFLRYRVHADGTAEFSMTIFSVPNYQQMDKTLTYNCAIGKGMSFFAAD